MITNNLISFLILNRNYNVTLLALIFYAHNHKSTGIQLSSLNLQINILKTL